jgi:hypothetical protein
MVRKKRCTRKQPSKKTSDAIAGNNHYEGASPERKCGLADSPPGQIKTPLKGQNQYCVAWLAEAEASIPRVTSAAPI